MGAPTAQITSQMGRGRLRHLWDVQVLWARSLAREVLGTGELGWGWGQRLVTLGVCQDQVVLELSWVRRGGCETLSHPCRHLAPQSLALPLVREQRRSRVATLDPVSGGTRPRTWGVGPTLSGPSDTEREGEKQQKKGSQGLFLELCCVSISLMPTDTWAPRKTLPRKIHS